jgi:hypothetical protein
MRSQAFNGLFVEGAGPQTLIVKGNRISLSELRGYPKRSLEVTEAFLDTRQKFPKDMLWWGIALFFLFGIGIILILLYYVIKEEVLVVVTPSGEEFVIKGKKETVQDLHYTVQKNCLKLRNESVPEQGSSWGGMKPPLTSGHRSLSDEKAREYEAKNEKGPGKDGDGKGKKRKKDTWLEDKKRRSGIRGKTIRCPECGWDELYYEAGLYTGYKYHCKRCDYIGPVVIEE